MGRRFEVERTAWVEAPPAVVYEQVADLRRWRSWMPWEGMDPTLVRSYDGPVRGVGARSSWTGGRLSSVGHVEIVEAAPARWVACTMVSERPVRTRSHTTFRLDPSGTGTSVTWGMTMPRTRATRLLLGLTASVDTVVGGQLDRGLARLRVEAEAMAAVPPEAA